MNTFIVLYRKEMLEMVRNYKWVWVPIVFILFGAMQPVSTYFLPEILAGAGNLPEGTVIEIPKPSGSEVLASTLQQYNTLGVLVIALSFMGIISGERSSGTAAMILVKPVSFTVFVLSKWSAMLTLAASAFIVGYGSSLYYTIALIGETEAGGFGRSLILYLVWVMFFGTVTIGASTMLRSMGAAAFLALGFAALLVLAASLFPDAMTWSPGRLPGAAGQAAFSGKWGIDTWKYISLTVVLTGLLLWISAQALRKRSSLDI